MPTPIPSEPTAPFHEDWSHQGSDEPVEVKYLDGDWPRGEPVPESGQTARLDGELEPKAGKKPAKKAAAKKKAGPKRLSPGEAPPADRAKMAKDAGTKTKAQAASKREPAKEQQERRTAPPKAPGGGTEPASEKANRS